ncbi:hypothetical protein MTP99_009254 [Tenebrio molitor]|nr:hypothetical protein MTP99_009254 [Tenebrio molitor]
MDACIEQSERDKDTDKQEKRERIKNPDTTGRYDRGNSGVDADLVFENLEQTDLANHENHHRIAKDTSNSQEVSLESSPPVEEHWLSSTVNRIKRSINNFLSSKSKSKHNNRTKRKSHRVPRQHSLGSQEEAEEDYDDEEAEEDNEYNEEGENGEDENPYEDNEDDNEYDQPEPERGDDGLADNVDEDFNVVNATEPTYTVHTTEEIVKQDTPEFTVDRDGFDLFRPETSSNHSTPDSNNKTRLGYDDEDNLITSGEGSSDGSIPLPIPEALHPIYCRISFTVSEPYVETFADRNSFKYRDVSEELVREIDKLYLDTPGTQFATVIKIEKREADAFTSKVTVDLSSQDYNNNQVLKDVLYKHIESQHRLGSITVLPEDFHFRVFEAGPNAMCDQLLCISGECIPSEARCNGRKECADGSDELGCDIEGSSSTTTTTTTVEPPIEAELGSGEVPEVEGRLIPSQCRADDVVQCTDGSRVICADQICDGIKDCEDGADEQNCPTHDCAEGEVMCDVSRCIPQSKICDGETDCDDHSDESNCVACAATEISCDNKCFPSSKRCDGTPDCRDGSDERNCPGFAPEIITLDSLFSSLLTVAKKPAMESNFTGPFTPSRKNGYLGNDKATDKINVFKEKEIAGLSGGRYYSGAKRNQC